MKHWFSCGMVMLAVVAAFQGLPPQAIAASDGQTALGPVEAALASGDPATAERLASAALQSGDAAPLEHAEILVDRGVARERLGERDDALVDFTEAIDLGSFAPADLANALFDRGATLDELGRTDDAIGDYSAVIHLVPNSARALSNRANAYRRQGHLPEAVNDYRASLAAGNAHPEYPYYGLGQIAEAQGDKAAARDDYGKALAANPQYDLAAARLAALGDAAAAPQTAPETAPDTGAIVLRPPPGANVAATPPPATVDSSDSGVIVLHPPSAQTASSAPADEPVVLHPPQSVSLHPPGQQSTLTPANYGPDADNPGLRPAIVGAHPGSQIQLGAWRSEAEAEQGWGRASKVAGDLLEGLAPDIQMADVPGKGRYYRLRAGPVGGGDAQRLCAALSAKGLDCIPAWN